ncbi:hypothetical protein ABIA71_002662 [Stenotrophomonas sp. 2619]|uniref:DUF2357 domain-containing protein n=1 Tax=Stenotrophomonas sp. 2619 TaxID=3156316 RepID=UPI0033922670
MIVLICHDQARTRFEVSPGDCCSGFRETGVYEFQVLPDGATLYIDEAAVEPVSTAAGPVLRWQAGFYAGEVSAEVVDSLGRPLASYRLDVAPDARKMGAALYQQMMAQIQAFDPALLLGSEAAQGNIGVVGDVTTLFLQYARLRRHSEGLIKALQQVAARPLTRLQHERRQVPFQRVRRIDATSARRLMARAETAGLLRRQPSAAGSTPLLEVVQSAENLDNPANRALAATLSQVRLRCAHVASGLAKLATVDKEEGARTPLASRIGRKLEYLEAQAGRLQSLAKLSPYANVSRREVGAAGLTAISAHPEYARAYRLGWATLRPGVAGPDRDEQLWLSPTWEIYERWCYVRILDSLRTLFPGLAWARGTQTSVDVIRYVGAAGHTRVEASLQRTFVTAEGASKGLRSISLQLKPDILVTTEIAGARRMLVLDAKYRTGRHNILQAMRSAHLYQDALRWDGQRPDCSLLLVPAGGDAPWLEVPAFHAENRTGVHVLALDQPAAALDDMLRRWLDPAQPAAC